MIRGSSDESPYNNYARIKIGNKAYDDATLDLKILKKQKEKYYLHKETVLRALAENDICTLRDISNYFYRTNGIYQKVVNYYATMYRFDWFITPQILTENYNQDKVVTEFIKQLDYFDASDIKQLCSDWSLMVIRDGVYYGYVYEGTNQILVQDLPWQYCRSRYKIGNRPAVEFDMHFFDKSFPDIGYRMRMLDLFPPEFKKGYLLYKQGKLPSDDPYNPLEKKHGHWYILDPNCAFKFSIFGTKDLPLFINAIPEIIDLGVAQGVDQQRQLQQLLKIIVQKLPLDKNGDLIFDIDEARDIHANAVDMLAKCIGVDVLTTFADIEAIDVSDATSLAKDNSLDNSRKTVYDALGVSRNIFNTEGNLALSMSILEDEGIMRNLLSQFEILFNRISYNRSANKKKWNFRFYFLQTTQYNYQALAKLYKEHAQIGFSKMLPQIALGQSQSFILNTAYFENEVLELSQIMIPLMMSSTMSAADMQTLDSTPGQKGPGKIGQKKSSGNQGETGRPKKDDSELSEKTIQNKESMS